MNQIPKDALLVLCGSEKFVPFDYPALLEEKPQQQKPAVKSKEQKPSVISESPGAQRSLKHNRGSWAPLPPISASRSSGALPEERRQAVTMMAARWRGATKHSEDVVGMYFRLLRTCWLRCIVQISGVLAEMHCSDLRGRGGKAGGIWAEAGCLSRPPGSGQLRHRSVLHLHDGYSAAVSKSHSCALLSSL